MAGKKNFTAQQNPALAFISAQEPESKAEEKPRYQQKEPDASNAASIKTTDAPEGFKANPLFVETKSRRMQLLVQPSLHNAIKAKAMAEGQSVNEFVHSILEAAIKGG